MQPFYLLVFMAGLMIAHLLLSGLRALQIGAATLPFERREIFLSVEERLCLATIEEAVGDNFRVLVKVNLSQVVQPEPDLGWRQERKAMGQLLGKVLDFLICSAVDGYPLCAVLASREPHAKARRKNLAGIKTICATAGLPLIELELKDHYELTEIRQGLLKAINAAEVQITRIAKQEHPAADEEALLASLAASMQEPDAVDDRHIPIHR
ncbi:MAG: DUF2726 domain-containing protein [Thiohalocapsa sp. PB-PSB1]|nr:MAG: DUF2726 domain-containing protein [Thiohalocapsa sp. PB-PSB1]